MTDRDLGIVIVVVLREPEGTSRRALRRVLANHHPRHVVGALVGVRTELAAVGAAPELEEHSEEQGSGGDTGRGQTPAVSRQACS
jgi:hypothetical protein